jgi:thiopurine S-methyltransferase
MDSEFWLNKWQVKEIGFHQAEANPLLVKYFEALHLNAGSRVFLPLCGKTLDIAWLLGKGYRVAGAELSEIAVAELFAELGVEPAITEIGGLKHYAANSIDIFVGDIFTLSANVLGPIDAIYDRAALVALPEDMRHRYTNHLKKITNTAPQLLICFEYDQAAMAGPPFCIDAQEVQQHYRDAYDVSCVAKVDVAGGLKGICPADECVWLLLHG